MNIKANLIVSVLSLVFSCSAVKVKMPSLAVIKERLSNHQDFVEKTMIDEKLANQEKEALGVFTQLELSMCDYCDSLGSPVAAVAAQMNKPRILEALLRDFPEALQELAGLGMYTFPAAAAASVAMEGPKAVQGAASASDNYELFKVVQKIYAIVDRLRADAEIHGTQIDSGKKGWPTPNPFYYRTKQGLFLFGGDLWTPWGTVTLTGGGCGTFWGFVTFKQQLLNSMKTSFSGQVPSSFSDNPKYYILRPGIDLREMRDKKYASKGLFGGSDEEKADYERAFQEITKEELKKYKGQNIFISSNLCGYEGIYKIDAVEGIELPEPELFEGRTSVDEYYAVNKAWEELEQRYTLESK